MGYCQGVEIVKEPCAPLPPFSSYLLPEPSVVHVPLSCSLSQYPDPPSQPTAILAILGLKRIIMLLLFWSEGYQWFIHCQKS